MFTNSKVQVRAGKFKTMDQNIHIYTHINCGWIRAIRGAVGPIFISFQSNGWLSTYICLFGFLVLPFALFCQQNTRKLLPRKNKSARVFFSNYESSIM